MFQNKVKVFILSGLWLTIICIALGLKTVEQHTGVSHALGYFREGTADFSRSTLELKIALTLVNAQDPKTIIRARMALRECRMRYKKIEFFMDYFFESNAMIYNRPAKAEVDEPYMEYQEPSGFQVIEALLYDDNPYAHQSELLEQAELLSSSAPDLPSLLYGFNGGDKELMESIRMELVKVITLSITGYDAPELKSGITESFQSVNSMGEILKPYVEANPATSKALVSALKQTLAYLKANPDFDSFNRMQFLTEHALPLQERLNEFILLFKLDGNQKSALNYNARNIYSPDALLATSFMQRSSVKAAVKDPLGNISLRVALGKRLFLETALSGNLKRSCASCHHPEEHFTEPFKTSFAIDEKSHVQRNAPTLLYAGFQYAQFWDGRVKTLEEQVKAVIANPLEMNGNHKVVVELLRKKSDYAAAFDKAFLSSTGLAKAVGSADIPVFRSGNANPVNMDNLAAALSSYIMTLGPRNSPFDQYMMGDKKAMTEEQVKGFNLFMGKAQCGSCHFAPLFNGLIPPFYKRTEYEILGTPGNDDFNHPKADPDQGRYAFFPINYYQAAFKTPTIRNVAKTAPYMHNGVFTDLEKVVEFYNLGGGKGIHLEVAEQSLSSKPLQLTDVEIKQIVVFMQSLTDKVD